MKSWILRTILRAFVSAVISGAGVYYLLHYFGWQGAAGVVLLVIGINILLKSKEDRQ